MAESPLNFLVMPWQVPKPLENLVPEHSRFFVYGNHSLFFAWRCNVSVLFTFQHGKESFSLQKPLQSQIISSREPILDILLIDHYIFYVSSSGLFQILKSSEKLQSGQVLKHLESCKTFLLGVAFNLSTVKRVLAVTPISKHPAVRNSFAVITCSHDNGTLNAEFYCVSQKSSSKVDAHLEFSSNICNNSSALNPERCYCYFLTQSQATTLFSDCKDADVLLVGLGSGQLFCIPFLMSVKKLGVRPTPRLIFQSHWSIIGLTSPPDGSNIFVFLQGGTILKISPLSNKLENSNSTLLAYSSFTLSHPVKCFSALASDQLLVSDVFNTSLIRLIPPDQTEVDTLMVKGITALSPITEESLIIASTSHNEFYLLNPASTSYKEDHSHLPWAGCDLDLSLQVVQEMKTQTEILSQLRNQLKDEDSLIKALSLVSRSPLMTKFFTLSLEVSSKHEDQNDKSPEEISDLDDFQEHINQKFVISVQLNNNSPEDFPSSLWKMGLEFRCSDGSVSTRNISLTRTFSRDFPFCVRFYIPFAVEVTSFPIEVKAYLLAEVNNIEEKSEWLKLSLGTVILDVSHFVSVLSQAPKSPDTELYCIPESINRMCDYGSFKEQPQEKPSVSCVVNVPEKFRQHNLLVDKILSKCILPKSAAKEKFFYNQSDKTVIWFKFLHKTLNLVFRKSCSSITISSSDVDFFHCFKLYLTSILKEESESDHESDHIVACNRVKNLNAVLETLSLEEALDHKKLLAIYQDLRNNVSPHMY